MTSIDFPQDTSIQLPYTSFPFTITNADGYITSNVLELQKYINSNSITDILSSYATNTNLNLKENILTFNTPLTRNTNTIGIDLSAYSTTGNMNTAISTALNSYTPTTALNNYTSNFNGWTKTGNDVYRTITGGNTMIGSTTNLGSYKLLVSGSGNFGSCLSVGFGNISNIQPNISGANFLILKHNTFNGNIGLNYPNPECFFIMGNNSSAGAIPWGFYSGVCKYFASSTPINSLRYDIGSCYINNTLATLTGTNTFSPLLSMLFNGNVGIGSSFPAYKLDVNGTTNSLNIFKNGINIDNIFISSNILQIQNYVNSNSIQDNLSFYISSNIIINLLTPYDTITLRNSALGSYTTTSELNNYTSNYISSNIINNILLPYDTINLRNTALSSYLLSSTASSTYATITNLNLKENALTFTSPLIRTTNTISLNQSLIDYNNLINKPTLNFLPLSGGTLTGNILLSTTSGNNPFYISSTSTTANNCIQIKNNSTNYGYIGLAGTTFGGNYQNNLFLETTNALVFNSGNNTSTSVPRMIILANGNVGIGNTNPQYLLDVNGSANINGILTVLKNNWIMSSDNIARIYFEDNSKLYFHSGATSGIAYIFRSFNQLTDILTIDNSGNVVSTGSITSSSGYSYFNGLRINGGDTGNSIYQAIGDLGITTNTTNINLGMNTYGTKVQISPTDTTIYNNLTVSKITPSLNIKSSSEADSAILYLATPFTSGSALKCAIIAQGQSTYSRSKLHFCLDNTADNSTTYNASVSNSRMSIDYNGNVVLTNSLTFKTDVWNYSTDNNQRLYFANAGVTYYQGYGQYALDVNHEWRNHQGATKMRLDNSGNLRAYGALQANFLTIANTNRDLVGIAFENTAVNDVNSAVLYCINGTFTGWHRCFTDDELFNNDNPQQFKDDYEGRIVISTGKIATDTTDNGDPNNTEWEILYDKAGITIEDALPKIELSRTKKDKRVFGVLGDKRRHNNRPERMIVNSVGEGGIWICNSNGNIENGDYITSSDFLGYGEKQDDDLLHNYTVAKATMDCNFELDSQYYKCLELNETIRIAFISSTYHCG